MTIIIRLCALGALAIATVAFAGMNGWLGAANPTIWGSSLSAWAGRLILALSLASLSFVNGKSLRIIRMLAGFHVLVLGVCGVLFPQEPTNPLYVPALSALTLACLALATLLLETRAEIARVAVPWLALASVTLNAATLIGYIYHTAPLYGGREGTVGICSASASVLLGIGLLGAAGSQRLPLRLLCGRSITAQLLRSLLPVTCGAMLLGELMSDLIRSDDRTSLRLQDALQTLISTLFITGVVLVFARRVGKRLEFAERERKRAENALATINSSLAETIADRTKDLQHVNNELHKEIGHRRAMERTLRDTEANNGALLSALPDWIFRFRADGTVLDLRRPRSGGQPGDFQMLEALPPTLTDHMINWVRNNCYITTCETVNFRFPAEEMTYEARFVPSGDAELLAVVRDISEITRLEREVAEANIREQRRIGEELHDGLGQQLTAVAFMTKLLEMELTEQGLRQAAQAENIGKQLSAAISTIRTLARGLFRYELGSDSLVGALQELANLADKNFRVQCTLDADGTIDLSDRTADLHLYRITQEAISNAVKHGHAKNICLQLKREHSKIVFTIRDDGAGSDSIAANHAGIGLRTMEYRTHRLGGRLGIESAPGKGTVITCTLPLSAINPQTWSQTQQLLLFQ